MLLQFCSKGPGIVVLGLSLVVWAISLFLYVELVGVHRTSRMGGRLCHAYFLWAYLGGIRAFDFPQIGSSGLALLELLWRGLCGWLGGDVVDKVEDRLERGFLHVFMCVCGGVHFNRTHCEENPNSRKMQ